MPIGQSQSCGPSLSESSEVELSARLEEKKKFVKSISVRNSNRTAFGSFKLKKKIAKDQCR